MGNARGCPEEVIAAEGASCLKMRKPLLDRRIDAVHVEDRGALALAREAAVNERARDLARVQHDTPPEKRHLVGFACRGGENREVVFEVRPLVAAHT